MITLKQLEKDERRAFYVIKTFIQYHPMLSYTVITIGVIIATLLFSIVMLLGAIGGNQADIVLQRQVCSGQITPGTYHYLMGFIVTVYNIFNVAMNFIIAFVIVFWIYIAFREYLKYKRDNL